MYNKKLFKIPSKVSAAILLALIIFILGHSLYVLVFRRNSVSEDVNDLVCVYYIDVGQGDSMIIQADDGFNMLIDAGESSDEVIEYAKGLGINKFNYVIATHPHSDHIGGMADIISSYEIDSFVIPDVIHTSVAFEEMLLALDKSNANVIKAETGYKFGTDSTTFTIIGPGAREYDNLNNYSVSLIMDFNDIRFLFTGDAETESEKEMAEKYDLSADVLKIPHHGSSTGLSDEFFEEINPQIAVISCGKDNSYGHPHKETLEKLETKEVKILRTDEMGTVAVYTDGVNVFYDTEK